MDAEEIRQQIETEYHARQDKYGWRLLYSPWANTESAKLAFVGLNPGGTQDQPDHSQLSFENGSAYVCESWAGSLAGRSPLQKQVCSLFEILGSDPADVLAGNLIPFRSKNWEGLTDKIGAIEFGINLWKRILENASPAIIVTMGTLPRSSVFRVLGVENARWESAKYGKQKLWLGDGLLNGKAVKTIGLPHLSRFKLFSRQDSCEKFEQFIQHDFTEDFL
jgi:hypothetical protein